VDKCVRISAVLKIVILSLNLSNCGQVCSYFSCPEGCYFISELKELWTIVFVFQLS
jgi:hypothetical protein